MLDDGIFTYGELQTILFEIVNLLNERPIGLKPGTDIECGRYLSPNYLLLGRATSKYPSSSWKDCQNMKTRRLKGLLLRVFTVQFRLG